MAWTYLLVAGLMEVGWAVGLKYTDGWSRLWPSLATLACMGASLLCLSAAVKTVPIGTAYAVWTGIGAAGTVVLGILLLNEPCGTARIICILLIVSGIVGLKLA